MKKILPIALSLVLIIAAACVVVVNRNNADNTETVSDISKNSNNDTPTEKASTSDKDETENKDKKLAKKINSKGKDTLLIYMVGSDLETRSRAGTDDLNEIAESGIDLKKANVLVYAGGAKKWHNDIVYEENNTILQLGKKGFEAVAKMKSSNMGDAECLLEFLNYSCENYPSDSYSLIMWDHGNGPIIGYGKDMLFDNDSLTLSEMHEALKASPFGKGKKLEWVGFDACLMSSAELVCTWDNYAKYLVASQEVEPSFGWNYSFLKDFGAIEPVALIKNAVEEYINECNAYYAKRGYENRDTTLACIDLSYAGELENAINNLFGKAECDVYTEYNKLVSKRVNTRALGRASTGSEYDLIDLNDMAKQLSEIYPEETNQISEAIKKLVIKNGTNTQGCCGISLYYPFYNKYYYEESWGDAYGQIGLFANYKSYLNKYQNIWLKDDKLDRYASSNTPEKVAADSRSGFDFSLPQGHDRQRYKLQLTDEQAENFAEAKVYILERRGKGRYHIVFSDNSVADNDGILTYDFEGKGIFVKNKFCDYYLPVSTGYDSVGDISRYSLKIRGKNIEKQELKDALFNVSLNKKTGEVNLSSITPYSKSDITGGKLEELDINDWDYIFPMKPDYLFLQRYGNGVVKPLSEWTGDGSISWYDFLVKDGIEFVYAALDNWDYSLIFEITDTQNNKYCSEPIAIEVEAGDKETYKPADIDIEWSSGERVKIFEAEDSVLYLKKAEKRNGVEYLLEAENKSDFIVDYVFSDVVINENIMHGYASLRVLPGETNDSFAGIQLDGLTDYGIINEVYKISGKLTAEIIPANSIEKIKTIEKNQTINIDISGEAVESNLRERYPKYEFTSAYYGATSGEQEIFNNEKFKITLLAFGKAEQSNSSGVICIENLTDEKQAITLDSYSVNGYTFDTGGGGILLPKCRKYHDIYFSDRKLKQNGISAIKSLKIKISVYQSIEQYYDKFSDEGMWIDIKLNTNDIENTVSNADTGEVIFNKNDVKVIITDYGFQKDKPQWKVVVENESDRDISVSFGDENSISSSYITSSSFAVGAHNKKSGTLSIYTNKEVPDDIPAKIYIMDYYETEILYTSDEMVMFHNEPLSKPTEEISVEWTSADEQILDDRNGVTISIKQFDWYGQLCYALEFQNKREEEADFNIYDIIINGDIVTSNNEYVFVEAGETKIGLRIPYFCAVTDMGVLDEIYSISFKIKETSIFVKQSAFNYHTFNIRISDDAVIKNITEMYKPFDLTKPYMGAWAGKQEILNNGKIKIEFMGFGQGHQLTSWDEEYYEGEYGFCAENTSEETQVVTIEGSSVNDAFINPDRTMEMEIPPKCKAYFSGSISDFKLKPYGITAIEKLTFAFSVSEKNSQDHNLDLLWLPINLAESGIASNYIKADENIIFDMDGIKVAVDSFNQDQSGNSIWEFTVLNDTAEDVSVQFLNSDGKMLKSGVSDVKLGAKQYKKVKAEFYNEIAEELNFYVVVKDFWGEETILKSDELINVNNKKYTKEGE